MLSAPFSLPTSHGRCALQACMSLLSSSSDGRSACAQVSLQGRFHSSIPGVQRLPIWLFETVTAAERLSL